MRHGAWAPEAVATCPGANFGTRTIDSLVWLMQVGVAAENYPDMGSDDLNDIGEDDARLIEMSNRIFPRLTPVYVAVGMLLLASTPFYLSLIHI